MDVVTMLVLTWVDNGVTYTGEVDINDPWECGRLIGVFNEYIYALYNDSMLQCIETLIPSNLTAPRLRG